MFDESELSDTSDDSNIPPKKREDMNPVERQVLQEEWTEIRLILNSFIEVLPAPTTPETVSFRNRCLNNLIETLYFEPINWSNIQQSHSTNSIIELIKAIKKGNYCYDILFQLFANNSWWPLFPQQDLNRQSEAAMIIATFIAGLLNYYHIKIVLRFQYLDAIFDIQLLCDILHTDGEGIIRTDLLTTDVDSSHL